MNSASKFSSKRYMKEFLKIAHRGYSEKYPENTMPAFLKAIEAGADMIELDVHLTRDGFAVIIHDNDVDRTSNGRGAVKDMTLDELRQLDFNFLKDESLGEVRIPTLEELIDVVRGRTMLNIELKNCPYKYPGIERKVADIVRRKGVIDDVIISSFDHFALVKVKELDPDIRTGMLYEGGWLRFTEEVGDLGAYSIHPAVDTIDVDQLRWARREGYLVYPWVAKNRREILWLMDEHLADGAMVNDLSLFNEQET